jgi:hypothetical protein
MVKIVDDEIDIMHAKDAVQGACLCGAVSYEVDGPLNMMVHCHCSMCRKHHGGSFATFVAAPLVGFRWRSGEEQLVRYRSSAKGQRSFCRICGSVAPAIIEDMDAVVLPAANLSGDLKVRPQAHWFAASKAPWDVIQDDLPQYQEYPDEFGTTGVTRPVIDPPEQGVLGSCLCGQVAYHAQGQPLRMLHCHCSRCRRGRSSAHATNVIYRPDDFRFLRGAQNVTSYKAPDARFFTLAFCATCGGGIPHVSAERGIVIVPAGSLDTDPGVAPQGHIYVSSKVNWFEIRDDLPQYAEMIP